MRKKSILICIMLSVILLIGVSIITPLDDEHIDVIEREIEHASYLFTV